MPQKRKVTPTSTPTEAALDFRAARIERVASPDQASASYQLSLSSEEPVWRYFHDGKMGYEVLGHDPAAIDMGRAALGLAILRNHNDDVQVGRLVDIALDATTRKLAGSPRWSRSQLGQEIQQDVEDDIRQEVSVGYQVFQYGPDEKAADGTLLRRAVRWAPYEVSLVAIPADITVGKGRSAEDPPPPAPIIERVSAPEVRMSDDVKGAGGAPPMADTRLADLEALVANPPSPEIKQYAITRMADWFRKGTSVAEARIELYEELSRKHQAGAVPPAEPELTRKEFRQFSLARAIQTLIAGKRDGFEFEVSNEIAKKQGRSTEGFFVPTQVRMGGLMQTMERANELVVGTQADGGYLKFTEYAGFLDLLRLRMVTLGLGVQYLPGLVGDFQWVKKTAGSTGGWQSTELTNQTNSKWTLGVVTLAPKAYQDALITSRKLFLQSAESIESLIRAEIAGNHAEAMERAILAGTGASGQPTGISATSGIGDVAGGANGLQPSVANVWELYTDVAAGNGDGTNSAFVTHPLGKARLAQTAEFSGATGGVLWKYSGGSNPIDNMIGYRAAVTTAVPSAQTKGSSSDCYYIYFGDFSKVVFGEFGSLEIIPDMITLGPSQIKLMSVQNVDVGVLYPTAFSVMKDARP